MANYSKDEIKTGSFALIAVIVFLFLLFMVGAFRTSAGTYPVKVLFNFISGLETGATVRFAGMDVGRVEKVEILPSSSKANIQATISVDKRIILREDSEAYIDTLGLMGGKYIEVTPGTVDAGELEPGATLRGEDPLAMRTLYKRGMDVADKLEELLKNSNGIMEDNRDGIKVIVENIEAVSADAKYLAADLKNNPWKLFWKGKEKKPSDKKSATKSRKKFLGIF